MKGINEIGHRKSDELIVDFRGEQAGRSYEQQRADCWGQFACEISSEWIESLTQDEVLQLYKDTGRGVKLWIQAP
jgi:hypothetical protein